MDAHDASKLATSALFAAAASGDVDAIHDFFRQPAVRPTIDRINHVFRIEYEAALAENKSPFRTRSQGPRETELWYSRRSAKHSWMQELVFDEPTERGHVHVLAWFFSDKASGIIGDTIRGLLSRISSRVMASRAFSAEFTEMILTSHLFLELSQVERDYAMALMLEAAVAQRRIDTIRLLVSHGVGLTDASDAIMACASYGDPSVIETLTNCGVFSSTYRVLEGAAYLGKYMAARELIRQGMDTQADEHEFGPLHIAAEEGEAEIVKLFVTDGFADVNAQCPRGSTPLMSSMNKDSLELGRCRDGPPIVVLTLLQNGADVHLRDDDGRTALHRAARSEYEEILSYLLQYGADPNAQDNFGITPLHIVTDMLADEDYFVHLDSLLACGADPFLQDADGDSPFNTLLESESGRMYIETHPEYFDQQ
ncbi:hypothetical protein Poli38472_009351 [Pythium oligandrum]|uniref:Ankyrin n=1 Tax=Pythium oligandrum TaxID=41045 RepID=A0A8K1CKG3_PYTOL|nr:hypothetical protein Poli38472_009351 [Pythium oligandrum]|eukprot:TMW65184.1 hypothetical protein Poli38472_009351 [Pythium oligandrum]